MGNEYHYGVESEPSLSTMEISGAYLEDVHRHFEGTLTIDNTTGQFVGTMTDPYGMADFIGEKIGNTMCFIKLYRNRNPHGYPITYDYRKTDNNEWQGLYRYGLIDDDTGETTCNMYQLLQSPIAVEDFQRTCREVGGIVTQRREEIAAIFGKTRRVE